MPLKDDLIAFVKEAFRDRWDERDGRVVPGPADVGLSNEGVKFDRATVLYADLSASTMLVDSMQWWFAAEVYKTYLYCAGRIINSEGGDITSYDGDRVMALFIGELQSTRAVKCGLKINYAVKNIINPLLKAAYPKTDYAVKQVVGIDTSAIHAARTGVRGDNDLVWVGPAANYAAKLTTLSDEFPTWITDRVFRKLADDGKFGGNPRRSMWEKRAWTAQNNLSIHRSNWWWAI